MRRLIVGLVALIASPIPDAPPVTIAVHPKNDISNSPSGLPKYLDSCGT